MTIVGAAQSAGDDISPPLIMNQQKKHLSRFLLGASIAPLLLSTVAKSQPAVWTNTNIGELAGVWSVASNWSPMKVPTSNNSAQIGNGGEVLVTGSITASRIEVGKNGRTGSLTSSTAGAEIIIDSDFDIGEIGGDFATGPVTTTSAGYASISHAARLLIGDSGSGDLDLGQTNATSGAQASGFGTLALSGISLIEVVDDADVGQAGGTATAIADGTLVVTAVPDFRIGADLDIGQAGGLGQSTAIGRSIFGDSRLTVGADADVGRSTGSASGNSGDGALSANESTISIGFGNALLPGSLNIGDAGSTGNLRASGLGSVSLKQSSLAVADKINIGGLSGGSTNLHNAADGTLELVDSWADAKSVHVASIEPGTAGTAVGLLSLEGSLLTVDDVLALGSGANLSLTISGTNRADRSGTTGQYGAIDVVSATLGGKLHVSLANEFTPTSGDQFDLIASTGVMSGDFAVASLPPLPEALTWSLIRTDSLLRIEVLGGAVNGDFDADGDIDGFDYLILQRGLGTTSGARKSQGDADFDGDVDPADVEIWKSTYGSPLPYRASNVIPEPGAIALVLAAIPLIPGRLDREEGR